MNLWLETSEPMLSPRPGGTVSPDEVCVQFVARSCLALPLKECWYCRHADFHLDEEIPLEIGTCRYPGIVIP